MKEFFVFIYRNGNIYLTEKIPEGYQVLEALYLPRPDLSFQNIPTFIRSEGYQPIRNLYSMTAIETEEELGKFLLEYKL